jgi:hypothetical protein
MRSPDNIAKAAVRELVSRINDRIQAGCRLTPDEMNFLIQVHKSQKAEERDMSGEEDVFSPFASEALKRMLGRNHGAIEGF